MDKYTTPDKSAADLKLQIQDLRFRTGAKEDELSGKSESEQVEYMLGKIDEETPSGFVATFSEIIANLINNGFKRRDR